MDTLNRNRSHQKLYEIFVSITSKDEMATFMQSLMTPQEIDTVAKRIQIAELLVRGAAFRTVLARTGAALATTTLVNQHLHRDRGYKLAFTRWEEWVLTPPSRHPRSKM